MHAFLTILACLQAALIGNAYGRDTVSLNGEWNTIADIYDRGEKMKFFTNSKPSGKDDFLEYAFDSSPRLKVPGDWNSQSPEWKYYEGTMWYGRHFEGHKAAHTRQWLYFAGVSYRCKVWLNGSLVAEHEGSFFPFQAEVTDCLKEGDNFLCVEVNNTRREDAIPALDFDWWNYGGITRDVILIKTPQVFVNDWFVRLDEEDSKTIHVQFSLSDSVAREVAVEIPGLGLSRKVKTDVSGKAEFRFKPSKIEYWNPGAPKLYDVHFTLGADRVSDSIGFRKIEVRGTGIFINGKKFFGKSVSFHEEIPQRQGRACTREDAAYLVGEAEKLGVNMIRLAHYPQNEYIVRLAESKGIALWEEIPLWQKIKFSDEDTFLKAEKMYADMLYRDRNRCCVCFWGLANETRPGSQGRNSFLERLLKKARAIDSSRLFVLADDIVKYNAEDGMMELDDPMAEKVDVMAINKYLGWYQKWPVEPSSLKWKVAVNKPLIISEFGIEALKGVYGNADTASSWSEDYQLEMYKANMAAFSNIDNLAGISPWVLFDFRSPRRYLPGFQDGWNRKGLISDQGEYKKAWYYMHDYYGSTRP